MGEPCLPQTEQADQWGFSEMEGASRREGALEEPSLSLANFGFKENSLLTMRTTQDVLEEPSLSPPGAGLQGSFEAQRFGYEVYEAANISCYSTDRL